MLVTVCCIKNVHNDSFVHLFCSEATSHLKKLVFNEFGTLFF